MIGLKSKPETTRMVSLRIRRHWRQWAPGDVTHELPWGVAQTMVDAGIAEHLPPAGKVRDKRNKAIHGAPMSK